MTTSVFIIPGIGDSGPTHWQSIWQQMLPKVTRLQVPDWHHPDCDDWVDRLQNQLRSDDAILVAHSLGCLAVAHWAARHGTGAARVRGALLVAVPDPQGLAFPKDHANGFDPVPLTPLPFPSVVVASTTDRYGSLAHARICATTWGSELVNIGPRGHVNADSGLGNWPEGWQLLSNLSAAGVSQVKCR